MSRVVSLFLPRWPTDRLIRKSGGASLSHDAPLVLAGRHGGRRVVTGLNAAAEALGPRVGMPLAKAQALASGLTIMDADPRSDREGLERLALWALRFSPVAAADPPDGLVLDTTGSDHLHGGESVMLTAIVQRLAASGVEARAAIADTWGAAHAMARFSGRGTVIVPSGGAATALRPLPVAALRLESGLVGAMRTLGFLRIGDLMDQPRAPLALRFGPKLARRLDQALGLAADPIEPVRSPDLVEVRRVFGEPIGAPETIIRHAGMLVAALCAALEEKGLGARRLDLLFQRVDNSVQAIRVGTAQPVRDEKRLARLLAEKLGTVDPGFGIEIMTLAATWVESLADKQNVSSLVEETEPDISGLIDVLANRVGGRRVFRYAPVASDVPERSVMRVPPLSPASGSAWNSGWPRPPRLFPRPEPIQTMALLPDHPPVWFVWRGIRRHVRRADGPERIFGEWWMRDAEMTAVRDYFRVEDDAGERYWIFRAGDGENPETGAHDWFLHGIFG